MNGGHEHKLIKLHAEPRICCIVFSISVFDGNALPSHIVSILSVHSFKARFDKHWGYFLHYTIHLLLTPLEACWSTWKIALSFDLRGRCTHYLSKIITISTVPIQAMNSSADLEGDIDSSLKFHVYVWNTAFEASAFAQNGLDNFTLYLTNRWCDDITFLPWILGHWQM